MLIAKCFAEPLFEMIYMTLLSEFIADMYYIKNCFFYILKWVLKDEHHVIGCVLIGINKLKLVSGSS